MFLENNYYIVIKLICKVNNIDESQLKDILKDEDCRYLFFLLLNKYSCFDKKRLQDDFQLSDMELGKKNAEEKFFINKEFRDNYFRIIDNVNDENKKGIV